MAMVRESEEGAEELGHNSLVKKEARYAEEPPAAAGVPKSNLHTARERGGDASGEAEGEAEEVSGAEVMEGARPELAWETYLRKRGGREPQHQRLFLVAKRLEAMPSFTNIFYLRGCMPATRCTRL